jgi:drug/metabolite transporter (DMT)-like permease
VDVSTLLDFLDRLQDLVAVGAAAFGVIAALFIRRLGGQGSLTKGLTWAYVGFAAIAAAAFMSAYGDFISEITPADAAALVEDSLRAVGLVCFAVYFYLLGRAYAAMMSEQ